MGLLTAETTLGGEHFTFCKSCKRLSSLYLTDGGSRKTKLNANEPAASLALGGGGWQRLCLSKGEVDVS